MHPIPLKLLAGAGYRAMGNVDFRLLGLLRLGSVPGTQVPRARRRGALAAVLVAMAPKLLLS